MMNTLKSLSIFLVTIIAIIMGLFYLDGYLQTMKSESMVTVSASAVEADCPGEVCMILRVDGVSDSHFQYLLGKLVYPYKANNDFENRIIELSENGQYKLCAVGYPHKYHIGYLRYFVVGYGGYKMELADLKRQPTSGCTN